MPKRGPSPAERQEQERKLQQQTLAQANQVKARGGNLTTAQKQALLQEQNRQKELQRQQQAAIAAKKAADEAAAMAEAQKNPKLLQPEEPATVGPAQQDQAMRQQMYQDQPQTYRNPDKNMSPEELEAMRSALAARKDQMVRMEPQITPYNSPNRMKPGREIEQPINRINLDQFTSGERRPITPNPLRLGPQQQFNAMQQQMYQTQPQPEQPQPTQQQNQLQEQQPKQIEQAAPIKKTFIKRKNTEM